MAQHQFTAPPHEHPDPWHMHTSEEIPQEEHGAKTNTAILVLSLLFTLVFLVGVIVACVVYYNYHITGVRRERIETTVLAKDYLEYRDRTDKALNGYGWAGPEAAAAGTVSIPLDQAKQRVLDRYSSLNRPASN